MHHDDLPPLEELVSSKGKYDLFLLEKAVNYSNWLHALIKPYMGSRILEVGAGIGTYTDLLAQNAAVMATDVDKSLLQYLNKHYGGMESVKIIHLDLEKPSADEISAIKNFAPDTILSMNVMEHVSKDRAAFELFRDVLPSGGRIVTIVPAMQSIFGSMDKAYGHYRRYDRSGLESIARDLDMTTEHIRYFNYFGIPAWYYYGKIRERESLSGGSVWLFDSVIVPVISVFEKILSLPVGMSIISVFRKK